MTGVGSVVVGSEVAFVSLSRLSVEFFAVISFDVVGGV